MPASVGARFVWRPSGTLRALLRMLPRIHAAGNATGLGSGGTLRRSWVGGAKVGGSVSLGFICMTAAISIAGPCSQTAKGKVPPLPFFPFTSFNQGYPMARHRLGLIAPDLQHISTFCLPRVCTGEEGRDGGGGQDAISV